MSKADQAPEPTMDEILASIRRIISDEPTNTAATNEELEAQTANSSVADDIASALNKGPTGNDKADSNQIQTTGIAADSIDDDILDLQKVATVQQQEPVQPITAGDTPAQPASQHSAQAKDQSQHYDFYKQQSSQQVPVQHATAQDQNLVHAEQGQLNQAAHSPEALNNAAPSASVATQRIEHDDILQPQQPSAAPQNPQTIMRQDGSESPVQGGQQGVQQNVAQTAGAQQETSTQAELNAQILGHGFQSAQASGQNAPQNAMQNLAVDTQHQTSLAAQQSHQAPNAMQAVPEQHSEQHLSEQPRAEQATPAQVLAEQVNSQAVPHAVEAQAANIANSVANNPTAEFEAQFGYSPTEALAGVVKQQGEAGMINPTSQTAEVITEQAGVQNSQVQHALGSEIDHKLSQSSQVLANALAQDLNLGGNENLTANGTADTTINQSVPSTAEFASHPQPAADTRSVDLENQGSQVDLPQAKSGVEIQQNTPAEPTQQSALQAQNQESTLIQGKDGQANMSSSAQKPTEQQLASDQLNVELKAEMNESLQAMTKAASEVVTEGLEQEIPIPAQLTPSTTGEKSDLDNLIQKEITEALVKEGVDVKQETQTASPATAEMSETTAQQTLAQHTLAQQEMAQSKDTSALSNTALTGSGESPLEQSIKEMLKPMLKEWLNENMPRLVRGAMNEDTDQKS